MGLPVSARGEDVITSFTTDSRDATPGAAFIALKGRRLDGGDYVASAIAGGAVLAIARDAPAGLSDFVLRTDDPALALGKIAAAHKAKIAPRTAGITGSAGKTTVKDMTYAVLSRKGKAGRSEGNHNNEIGLPLSLLTLTPECRTAVYELAMSARGEISYLTRIVRPDIAVITNIGNMHIEQLGSREAIRDAKMEIVEGLPRDGVLILNGDEPLLAGIEGAVYVARHNADAEWRIANVRAGENGTAFDLLPRHSDPIESIAIPVMGEHNVFNAALTYAVCRQMGFGEMDIRRGLLSYRPEALRQQVVERRGKTLIEDCYNAGPESMSAALTVLSDMVAREGGRAVALLGDMRELGDFSRDFHRRLGEEAARRGVEVLFTVGDLAEITAEAAQRAGVPIVESFAEDSSPAQVAEALACQLRVGDKVLIKASRALHLESIAELLEEML